MRPNKRRPLLLSAAVVIVLGVAMASSAASQSLTGPAAISLGAQPGARVRVSTTTIVMGDSRSDGGSRSYTGTVVAIGQGGMALRPDHPGDSLSLIFAGIDRVDLSRGRHGHAVVGLEIGAATGGLAGVVFGVVNRNRVGFQPLSTGDAALAFGIVGGAAGAIVGPVVGALIRTERWHTVWMRSVADHAHASLDLVPNPTGARLGFRVVASL